MFQIIETDFFKRKSKKILTANERSALTLALQENPLAGDVISGTGGVRKIRLAKEGRGKSGGYRVIYFFYNISQPLYLLDLYAKSDQANLTKAQCNMLAKMVIEMKKKFKMQEGEHEKK